MVVVAMSLLSIRSWSTILPWLTICEPILVSVFLLLMLLVFVLEEVRSDGSNYTACQRSKHASAQLVADKAAGGATKQCCTQTTLTLLSWSRL